VTHKGNADGLRLISIRLRDIDVRAAKAEAKRLAVPYQVLIRQWVAEKVETMGNRRKRVAS
jgi:predicted DNA binding CopG/RHH family protein